VPDITRRQTVQLAAATAGLGLVGLDKTPAVRAQSSGSRELWSYSTDRSETPEVRTVANQSIVVGTDRIYALSAGDGTERWAFPAGSGPSPSSVDIGLLSVTDSTAYLRSDGRVAAVDSSSGTLLWRADTGASRVRSAASSGGSIYVLSSDGTIVAYDAVSGDEQWRVDTGRRSRFTLRVVDNTIVVIGRQTLLGVSPADGTERWRSAFDQDSIGAFPGVTANTIYVVSSAGTVFNLNASTGTTRWEVDTPGTGFPDILLTLSTDSVTVAASESVSNVDVTDGSENWQYAPSGVSAIETTFEGETVYAHADDSLIALDLETGVEQWQTPITGPPTDIGPRTISGTVVAPSNATITGVAADSGQVRGERTFDGTGDVRLTPVDGGPLLVSRGGRVYGVDPTTITEQWGFNTGSDTVVVSDSTQTRTIVSAGDGTVYALSTESTVGGGDEPGSGDDGDGSDQGGFESGTPPATYDANGNGSITARELGQAVRDYATGNLTAAELGEVVTAFAVG